ncbi:Fic family protein [Flavobacterium sp. CS20]|uniref:Fic family protein n=1 Tax=Flavobacterium sp. CS20 TaxID=2775246 RepID=UPI001B3A576C|nr:Fic family protein [Flavobacterium sp. CS20]QTY26083.1 Fic family protein [Flavobacterium sp. CS20]
MLNQRYQQVIDYIRNNAGSSSKDIFENSAISVSYATLKRTLKKLISKEYIVSKGQGKGTKYFLSPSFELIQPIDIDKYYENEIDERQIKSTFNFELVNQTLIKNSVFTENELNKLKILQKEYENNIKDLNPATYQKELERLAIDLSWKSSQIEGNTYSLLETERLLKEKHTASGKTKEEAIMLLNHKEALDFIIENKDYLTPITVSKIEDIHRVLTKDLGVEKNLRKRRVGISGTNYRPLDNEFQILEALKVACKIINNKDCVFEKALLALVLISYIQPFMDGNKRTSRIVSNAILLNYNHCPISFRTVESIAYKKAMLLFYEQNNISNFKNIFIEQFEFAVKTYF